MPAKSVGRKKKVEAPVEPVAAVAPVATVEVAAEAVVAEAVVAEAVVAEAVVAEAVPPPALPVAVKKKGGAKKPVKVIAVVTPDGIEGSFTPEPRRPLIAHLPIRPSELSFSGGGAGGGGAGADTTAMQPQAYDPYEMNPFKENPERLGGVASGTGVHEEDQGGSFHDADVPQAEVVTPPATTQVAVKSMPCFTRANLMVQFKESSEKKCLPASTEIACFWCAHRFEWGPCIIPEREVNGVYNVYGNFCAPECAMSYLLGETLDPHVRWERLSLLQRIYDRDGVQRIFPAPCREALKLFGGPMDIETYRATVSEKRVRVDLHMPPMVSILGSIDTKPIDFFDTTLKHKGPVTGPAPAASLSARAIEEGLRLKRTKPLKDRESTLDTVMNIKIGGAARGRA